MPDNQIVATVRAVLVDLGCPAHLAQEKAEAIAVAQVASGSPMSRLAIVDGDVRIVDAEGAVCRGQVLGEPLEVKRFIADFLYYSRSQRWTLTPIVA